MSMATHEDQVSFRTLAFLAEISGQLDAFRHELKQTWQLHASSFVECRYYGDDLYICVCLEAALFNDKVLTWWLDITPRDQQWLIEATALWNGRDPVAQLPGHRAVDFHQVQHEVPAILEQLLQTGMAVVSKTMREEAAAQHPETRHLT